MPTYYYDLWRAQILQKFDVFILWDILYIVQVYLQPYIYIYITS